MWLRKSSAMPSTKIGIDTPVDAANSLAIAIRSSSVFGCVYLFKKMLTQDGQALAGHTFWELSLLL